jgi:acetamidase/formamidase
MPELDAGQVHYEWNNAIAPRLEIEPGDTVVFQTRDAADGFYSRASTHADVLNRGPFRGHPLTGPVRVRGAGPGDVLVVEILDVRPAADFGWTNVRPGRGLLPESDFSKPFLQIWDLSDGTHARMDRRVAVPIEAFPGVMGTALDEPGGHSTMPPRKNGGNMDIKQLTRGATLYLPVWVPGMPRRVTARCASPPSRCPRRQRSVSASRRAAASRSPSSARPAPSPRGPTPRPGSRRRPTGRIFSRPRSGPFAT